MSRARRVAAAVLALLAVSACVETSRPRRPSTLSSASAWVEVDVSGETLECDGAYVLFDGQGRQVGEGAALPAGTPVSVSLSAVKLGAATLPPPPLELRPLAGAVASVDGHRYRGQLRVDYDVRSGRARIFNRLLIEDYLLGVVPSEMPESFGLEALKAQAVAARSYALAEMAQRGWLYSDTRSQVYDGRQRERPLVTRAVQETAGEVLMHDGRPVKAYYNSTCGGRSVPASAVFPDDRTPGVMERGVVCPDCRRSPFHAWVRRVAAARVCAAAGLPPAPLDSVEAVVDERSGRAESFVVRAGGREATVAADAFRSSLSSGMPLAEQILSTRLLMAPRIEGDALVLEGQGWGHGVGLCQYGASGFASRGGTYRQILSRYYPGAELVPGA
ncbi:MAG TPA: SpoIID/LytB domain-containing protein [Planctomycetota bacterium]|nr:SpoIID/LytB domain-containing protein [Planctomycetota bacterium]